MALFCLVFPICRLSEWPRWCMSVVWESSVAYIACKHYLTTCPIVTWPWPRKSSSSPLSCFWFWDLSMLMSLYLLYVWQFSYYLITFNCLSSCQSIFYQFMSLYFSVSYSGFYGVRLLTLYLFLSILSCHNNSLSRMILVISCYT